MKIKIAILSSALISLILLGCGTLIYTMIYNRVLGVRENALNTEAQAIAQQYASQLSDVGRIGPKFVQWLNRYDKSNQKIYIYGSAHELIATVGDLAVPPSITDVHSVTQPFVETAHDRNKTLIYAVRPVSSDEIPGRVLGYIVFASDFSPVNADMHLLLLLLMGCSVAAILLAGCGGYVIALAALRPIDRLMAVVERIGGNHLGERVDASGHDEVARLTRTFNSMLSRVQKSFEQQRQFVADASHEIRTPLTTIVGYTDLLDRWGKSDPEVVDAALTTIRSESIRLCKLADDLLFLAGLEAKRDTALSVTDLDPVIQEVATGLSLVYPDISLRLHLAAHSKAAISQAHCRQIITNLVGNAFKYTAAGGTVSLSTIARDNQVIIHIEDSGCGISADDLPYVFDRFYRADKSRQRQQGGNGLGLAIVKELVDSYDGCISIVSKEGAGTTVIVKFEVLPDGGGTQTTPPWPVAISDTTIQ